MDSQAVKLRGYVYYEQLLNNVRNISYLL